MAPYILNVQMNKTDLWQQNSGWYYPWVESDGEQSMRDDEGGVC